MSLSARKKVAKHAHTTDEVKAARKYVSERPQQLSIPASEVIISATETATTYLSNMTWAQSYELSTDGAMFFGKNKVGIVVSTDADANVVFQYLVDNAPEGTCIFVRDGTFPELHVVVTNKRIKIQGDGIQGTFLKPKSGSYAITFTSGGVGVNKAYTGYVNDLTISGAGVVNAYGVKLTRVEYGMIQNVVIRVNKNAFYCEAGYNNRLTDCVGEATAGYAFYFAGVTTETCDDPWLTNCIAQSSTYDFFMGDNSSGFQLKTCGASACTTACFTLEGNTYGGWANDCWADSSTGDGWIIKNSATHYSGALQLSNIWGSYCKRGLVVSGSSITYHVDSLQISNGNFCDNKRCGIRLEGYITNSKLGVIASANNSDNVLTEEATNLLIYQNCQQVSFSNSQFKSLQGASRKETVRLVMDTSAGGWQITNFYNCILEDNDVSKAKFGIKNTHASYTLQLYISSNRSINNTLQDQYVLDPASTGIVQVYNLSGYLSSGSSFPTTPFVGQYFYRDDLNILYRYSGAGWYPVHNTTGEGTAFPATKQTGDIFFRTDEGKLYKWDGSKWVEYLLLTSTGGNLVCNSDFEVPTLTQQVNPYGWSPQAHTGTPTFNRVNADQVSGAYCLTITNDSASDYGSWYGDYFPVLPSRPYLLSGYCKSTLIARRAEIFIMWYDKSKAYISANVLETNLTTWTRLSKVITAPANAAYGRIELRGYVYASAAVTYSYDNVKFVELSVSGTAFPANPVVGDIFYHETYAQSFRYDPDSPSPKVGGWVALTRICHSGTSAERASASVVLGDFWFDTDQKAMYRWTGTAWEYMGTSEAPRAGSTKDENYILNGAFEEDFDADGIPDHWTTVVELGAPTFGISTAQQMKGGKSAFIACAGTGHKGRLDSVLFAVKAGQKYYVEGWKLGSGIGIGIYICMDVRWYAANKTTELGITGVDDSNTVTVVWHKMSATVTAPSNAYYAKVCLLNIEINKTVYFDDITFSKINAAVPTSGTIGGIQVGATIPEKTITSSWTDIGNFTVNADTECYFTRITFHRIYQTDASAHDDDLYVELVVDGVEYPSSTGSFSEFILPASGVQTGFPVTFMITVPKNLNGKTVYIRAKCPSQTIYALVGYEGWGHSPHTHTGE